MDAEVTPAPADEERAAIVEAVARLLADPPDPRSAWWRAGVAENVEPEAARPDV